MVCKACNKNTDYVKAVFCVLKYVIILIKRHLIDVKIQDKVDWYIG